jgi:putative Holliday junction resolvase
MRVLAVDPGSKRLGIAISDPTGTIARPLKVLQHISRQSDANQIARLASEHEVRLIIVGQSLDDNGKPTFEGRRAARIAAAIRTQTVIPVELWDEYYSTQEAQSLQPLLGAPKRKQYDHMDDLAASVILQSYLDSRTSEQSEP